MRILGIDPGVAEIGYGLLDVKEGKVYYETSGRIVTDKKKVFHARLAEISKDIKELLYDSAPYAVVVERIFFYKNISTCLEVAHARGCILSAVSEALCRLKEYTPGEIKQAIAGHGRCDKAAIKRAVNHYFEIAITNDNEADGVAAALTYALRQV